MHQSSGLFFTSFPFMYPHTCSMIFKPIVDRLQHTALAITHCECPCLHKVRIWVRFSWRIIGPDDLHGWLNTQQEIPRACDARFGTAPPRAMLPTSLVCGQTFVQKYNICHKISRIREHRRCRMCLMHSPHREGSCVIPIREHQHITGNQQDDW